MCVLYIYAYLYLYLYISISLSLYIYGLGKDACFHGRAIHVQQFAIADFVFVTCKLLQSEFGRAIHVQQFATAQT